MNSLTYLLQVSACTAVFYLFYYFFLNRLTFFTTNRWYLLGTVVLSFIIPLIKIQVNQPHVYTGVVQQVVQVYAPQVSAPDGLATVVEQTEVQSTPLSWDAVIKLAYMAAVLGFSIHLLVTLLAFIKRIKGKRIAKLGNINVLSGDKKITNGSFLNYIFLNDNELSPDEIQQIIAHEMLHVKLYHSVDRIIFKIAQIVLWFNPFIYLYARSVEENHEFEVDRAMAVNNDKHNYANLLLHLSVAGNGMLYHNFSKVPLKKRITMLFNQPSSNMRKIIYVLIAPVLLISCLAFAQLKSNLPVSKYSAIDQADNLPANTAVVIDGKVYPRDIIFKISSYCIKSTTFYMSDQYHPGKKGVVPAFNKGRQTVIIKTKHGKIVEMDDDEKQNLITEHTMPHTLYNRIALKNQDGSVYDKVIIESQGNYKLTSKIAHTGKAAFVINGKVFNEATFNNLPAGLKSAVNNAKDPGVISPRYFDVFDKEGRPLNLKAYETVFTFEAVTQKSIAKNLKSAPKQAAEAVAGDAKAAGVKINTDYKSDLYSRVEVKRANEDSQDSVVFKSLRADGRPGGHISSNIAHNAKVGVMINQTLYSEDDFKSFSPETQTMLLTGRSKGVATGGAIKRILKNKGYNADRTDVDQYAAIFFCDVKDEELTADLKRVADNAKYQQQQSPKKGGPSPVDYDDTEEGKAQAKVRGAIVGKTVTVTVKAMDKPIDAKSKSAGDPTSGVVFDYNGNEYSILCWNKHEKELKKQLKVGDVITMNIVGAASGTGMPVFVEPGYVMKNNLKIYEEKSSNSVIGAAEQDTIISKRKPKN